MAKVKMKTHRGAAKRFHMTARGKLRHKKAFRSHLLEHKPMDRKRDLRQGGTVDGGDARRLQKLLPYQ
ncbi:50S ribosomal protein L35 [Limnochorda pilosa]|uniref:Large ribosomal subunit protein bL35 n=1 Tax=Limnochorda pilosa TaxID=1555112 RepID=A0A0K2SMK6_LIMPI|nr:50S ribosomal protein L35 [Limnochorda pilosa]BAS28340.1 50S ribosomal protein L35 [Limnochorda pilosa]